jgi:hypothetical protein
MGCLSSLSAAVMAILRCRELLLTKNLIRRRIHICCDSRAGLAALAKTTESFLVWECMQVLGKLDELNKSHLMWIPGNQGVAGNEEAKEGAIKIPPSQNTAVPFGVCKKLIKKHLELKHPARLVASAGCRQFKTVMRYPMSRLRLRTAVGLFTFG